MSKSAVLHRLQELGIHVTACGDRLRLEPGSKVPYDLVDELRLLKPSILLAVALCEHVTQWAGDDIPRLKRIHAGLLTGYKPSWDHIDARDVLVSWAAARLAHAKAVQALRRLESSRTHLTSRERAVLGGRRADISFWGRLAQRQQRQLPLLLTQDSRATSILNRLIEES